MRHGQGAGDADGQSERRIGALGRLIGEVWERDWKRRRVKSVCMGRCRRHCLYLIRDLDHSRWDSIFYVSRSMFACFPVLSELSVELSVGAVEISTHEYQAFRLVSPLSLSASLPP